MARITFGNTPWGKAWLRSLDSIDWENRLPRGASYARNDRVNSIDIHENQIEAFVEGTRPKPYRVGVVALPLQKKDVKKLIGLIAQRPDLLSRILNRELPMELEGIAGDAGIQLFPRNWYDLKLTCSCPDWAVPCKHIAAVLYLVANEIDKNPFLVFSLIGVDLIRNLEKLGYSTTELSGELEVKTLTAPLSKRIKKKAFGQFEETLFHAIDLSKIPFSGADLIEFLPDPIFHNDIKGLLARTYKNLNKQFSQLAEAGNPEFSPWVSSIQELEIIINENGKLLVVYLNGYDEAWDRDIDNAGEFSNLLRSITPVVWAQVCQDIQFCALVHDAALQLLARGAILPEILLTPHGDYVTRWIPAVQIDEVREVVESLEKLIPSTLVRWFVEEEELYASPQDSLAGLFSIFLGDYLQKWSAENADVDPLLHFLTSGNNAAFGEFSERQIPAAFQQWMSNLQFSNNGHQPVLIVSEIAPTEFCLSIEIETVTRRGHDIVPYGEFIKLKQHAPQQLGVMRMIALISNRLPIVNSFLRDPDQEVIFPKDRIVDFLEDIAPVMRLTRMRVTLPKSLQGLIRPRPTGHFSTQGKSSGHLTLHTMLNFNWRISLGNDLIEPEEFKRLVESNTRLIHYRDQYILLDDREVAGILKRLDKGPNLSPPEMMRVVILGEYEGVPISLSKEVQRQLNMLRNTGAVANPKGLAAKLRPYQKRGYAWLYKNAKLGLGSILADDMGLGKTLQVLTLLLKLKNDGALSKSPALVVAPSTLLTNWERECAKFTPEITTFIYHGSSRSFQPGEADLVLTTYGLIRREEKFFARAKWTAIILDEAQAIKNPAAGQTRAVQSLKAPVKIAMSGTPVENRLMEYYSIFHFTNPGYLGSVNQFKNTFANPIEKHRNQLCLNRFRKITEPFIMRRMKTDKSIINDLPDKTEMNRYCELTKEQAALYTSITSKILKEIEESEGIERRGLILKLLLRLKQVCNHPYNFLKSGSRDIALTGKGESLMEVVQAIEEEGSKVLIFTQFREMGEILQEMLSALGEEAFFLHGGLSRHHRDVIVRTFQHQPYPRALILSIKAGGTGLNLTAATHVIHYDLWWNPAVERQATDRAFRIGQQHKVTVHRLITRNTLEEKIDTLIQSKKELADLTVVSGEKWIGELDDSQIRDLVAME